MLNLYYSLYILLHHFTIYYRKKKIDLITDCDTAFKQLKYALVHATDLAMTNFDANSMVEIDASDVAVGAVLIQQDWPVVFMSKALNSAQCNYHTMDHKLLVIVLA